MGKQSRGWVLGLLIALLFGLSWGVASSASAAVLYTADTAGAVLVQSRWTLRDADRHSWQVIAFQQIQPDGQESGIVLRLVGFPGVVEMVHPQPIQFVDLNGRSLFAADRSDQISANLPSHVGQYQLQSVLLQLPLERLQLKVPLQTATAEIRISPAMLEEWQTVANIHYSDLQKSCDKFPMEARQNLAFPAWVGCSSR